MDRRGFLSLTTAALAAYRGPFPRLSGPPRPVPTPQQLAWQRDELALFLHFGINTFTDREWGDGTESPALFNPAGLDARQWAGAARDAGFRLLVLTAKHHDGFCLWPSALTRHTVAASPWREGQGDVVREFTDACRWAGLKAGLYLSPWDRHEPSYGDSPRYNDLYIGQLTELLTRYGPLAEVWFDGANGEGPNGRRQVYDWPRIHRTVRSLQPDALIFSDAGPDIRWIGNERGTAGDPNWCMMDPDAVPYPGAQGDGIIAALQHGDAQGSVWRPGEADVSIRPGWFYHPAEDGQVRSPDNLLELYCSSVGRNAGLLLNVPPNRDGLLSAADRRSLAAFGSKLRDLNGSDHSRSGEGRVVRYLDHRWLELDFRKPVAFDHVVIREAIEAGQHIAAHRVDAWTDNRWVALGQGSTIGNKRIHRVARTRATKVRVTVTAAHDQPRLQGLGVLQGT